jgi:hypothetical protein
MFEIQVWNDLSGGMMEAGSGFINSVNTQDVAGWKEMNEERCDGGRWWVKRRV